MRRRELVSRKEVMVLTGLSTSHLYWMEKTGKFPRRIKAKVGRPRWYRDKVEVWVKEREMSLRVKMRKLYPSLVVIDTGHIIAFVPPFGMVFRNGMHAMYADTWSEAFGKRHLMGLEPCQKYPFCELCKINRGVHTREAE